MNVDSRESRPTHSRARRSPLPPVLSPIPTTPVEQALHAWDGDIRRAAAVHAERHAKRGVSADELAQTARIRLWRALEKDPALPTQYIRRLIINSFKSAMRAASAGVALVGEQEARNVPAEVTRDTTERQERVIAVMNWRENLPERDRTLFDLLFVEDSTQREVAMRLGVSQPRVSQLLENLLSRARIELYALAA